ncbi:MAG: M15 family metallopeptidase, partial [Bacteroidota bacterium]
MSFIRLTLVSFGLAWTLFTCQAPPSEPKAVQTSAETPMPTTSPNSVVDTSTSSSYAHLLNKAFITGNFNPATHPDFVRIEAKLTDKKEAYMHKEAYEAFLKMYAAAKKDGVDLLIRSATRNFNYQKGIWEAKWNGTRKVGGEDLSKTIPDPKARALKILEFSSMPGTSRHHWGTDIDFNSFENSYFAKGK